MTLTTTDAETLPTPVPDDKKDGHRSPQGDHVRWSRGYDPTLQ